MTDSVHKGVRLAASYSARARTQPTCAAMGEKSRRLPTGVRLLAADVLALEEGLPPETLDTGGAAWPYERRRQWRSLLETTTHPADVRGCLSMLSSASPVSLIAKHVPDVALGHHCQAHRNCPCMLYLYHHQ